MSVGLGSEQNQGHCGPDENIEPYLEAGAKPLKVKEGDQNNILEGWFWWQLETGLEIVGLGMRLLTTVKPPRGILNFLS